MASVGDLKLKEFVFLFASVPKEVVMQHKVFSETYSIKSFLFWVLRPLERREEKRKKFVVMRLSTFLLISVNYIQNMGKELVSFLIQWKVSWDMGRPSLLGQNMVFLRQKRKKKPRANKLTFILL